MDESWIKLYRKMKDKGWYRDSCFVHLWVHILIRANHEEKEFLFNGSIHKTRRGEFITGRNALVKETGINRSKIERGLDLFEKEGQIEQQKTNKFRLIRVINYGNYQSSEQQVSNKRATSEQQVSTNKNLRIKESKNKEEASISFLKNLPEEFIGEMLEKFDIFRPKLISEAEKAFDWLESNGRVKKNYKAYLRNWIRNSKVGGLPVYRERSSSEMVEWKKNQDRIAKTQESMQAGPSQFAQSLSGKFKM